MTKGLIVICVLVSGGCQTAPAGDSVTSAARVPVTTSLAVLGSVERRVEATATVVPAPGAELLVSAPAPARVSRVPFGEGERVGRGAVLVEFDIPALDTDVAARRSEIEQARARLTLADSALSRVSLLFDKGIAAQKEVEAATRERSDADSTVTQALAAQAAAADLAARRIVRAPFAGFVVRRWRNPGDLVDGVTTDPVVRLVDLDRLELDLQVPASEAGLVRLGQAVVVRAPSTSASVSGRVLGIPVLVDPNAGTFRVRASLTSGGPLPLGLPVTLAVVVERRDGIVTVPARAVVRDAGSVSLYIVDQERRARRTPVTVGLTTSDVAQIVAGLSPGTRVVVDGHDGLPDGASVEVRQ